LRTKLRTIFEPNWANLYAIALPIPRPEPVTKVTLSRKGRSVFMKFLSIITGEKHLFMIAFNYSWIGAEWIKFMIMK
jgi:hypothetical protein